MKKINCILIILIVLFSFAACKPKGTDKPSFANAVEYNDFLVRQQKNVLGAQSVFSAAIDSIDFTPASEKVLKDKFDEFGKIAKLALDTVKKLEGYNNNTQFRDDAIKMFQFYYDAYNNEYREMIGLLLKGDKITPEDQSKMNEIGEAVDVKEQLLINTFLESQKKFASENNIVLY